METNKGIAWKKNCVYSQRYSNGYVGIDWGREVKQKEHCGKCDFISLEVQTEEGKNIYEFREVWKALEFIEHVRNFSKGEIIKTDIKEICEDGKECWRQAIPGQVTEDSNNEHKPSGERTPGANEECL